MKGVQAGFQLFGQLAGLDMVAAKAFDPAAGHFQDMKEIPPGRYNLVKNRIGVPAGAMQAVVLALVLGRRTSTGRRSVVLIGLHGQLLSIDLVDPPAAFQVVLTRVAVLVLSSAVDAWFHARYFVMCELSETAFLIGLFSEAGRPVFSDR
ncbi:hypothetical protein BFL40_14150 [Pseudomonas costantinii]|uniref:Uncharacterized protein n=1 Tax=Pseudomonas costantinii TaxID=168469 RepID=A0A1S2V0B6_9PSED|nr:hypothetical protein BFL40_14150 [Pseudomonas costantinii]